MQHAGEAVAMPLARRAELERCGRARTVRLRSASCCVSRLSARSASSSICAAAAATHHPSASSGEEQRASVGVSSPPAPGSVWRLGASS